MTSASENGDISIVSSVKGTEGSPTGPDPENWEGDQAQVGQFLLGCECLVNRGIFVQEQDPLGEIPAAFFLQSVASVAPAKMSNTPRW